MNEAAIGFAVLLLVIAVVAAGVMLVSSRRPGGERVTRMAFWVVLGILFVFIGIFVITFAVGWYGGIGWISLSGGAATMTSSWAAGSYLRPPNHPRT